MRLRIFLWALLFLITGTTALDAVATWIWEPPQLLSVVFGWAFWMAGTAFGTWREGRRP